VPQGTGGSNPSRSAITWHESYMNITYETLGLTKQAPFRNYGSVAFSVKAL